MLDEPKVDFKQLIDDIDLERLLHDFLSHRGKKFKKFKKRTFTTFMFNRGYCMGEFNSLELSLKVFKIYVKTGIFIEKELKSIHEPPSYQYKVNLHN